MLQVYVTYLIMYIHYYNKIFFYLIETTKYRHFAKVQLLIMLKVLSYKAPL